MDGLQRLKYNTFATVTASVNKIRTLYIAYGETRKTVEGLFKQAAHRAIKPPNAPSYFNFLHTALTPDIEEVSLEELYKKITDFALDHADSKDATGSSALVLATMTAGDDDVAALANEWCVGAGRLTRSLQPRDEIH